MPTLALFLRTLNRTVQSGRRPRKQKKGSTPALCLGTELKELGKDESNTEARAELCPGLCPVFNQNW
jgi:hypothetical protein